MTRKGIRLIFLNQDGEIIVWLHYVWSHDIGGNANKRVDADVRMGKSCLFFLSLLSFQRVLGIESLEDKDVVNVKSYGSSMIPISDAGP